jgi:diguanylate cyclase
MSDNSNQEIGLTDLDRKVAFEANKKIASKPGGTTLLHEETKGENPLGVAVLDLITANVELAEENIRDPLTGLYNRRYLEESLKEIEEKDENAAIMIFDIDHFKGLNDDYGHPFGDLVLRGLGRQLNEITRQERLNKDRIDIAARFGGDEFVVVFRKSSFTTDALRETCERITRQIESRDYRISDESESPSKRVTVSVGCASRKIGETVAFFLDRADKALYKAKQNGRNQVVLSD